MHWNLASVWESVADALPDRTVLVHGDRRSAWSAFDDRAARFADALRAAGLRPGSKVAQFLFNSPEYVETLYGTFKARAVPVNVNYRYVEDELAYLLHDSDTEALVFHGALAGCVAAVLDRIPGLKLVVQVDDGCEHLESAVRYEELLAAHDPMERIERTGDELMLLYTGGTTGMPKGVMWRQEDLYGALGSAVYPLFGAAMPERCEEAGPIARALVEAGSAPVHLPASPLMHGTGSFTTMQALFLGATVVTLENRHFDPHELWQVVERERVTQMAIVGDAFAKPMVAALEEAEAARRPYDLSSVQLVVSSGVMWSEPVKAALVARGNLVCLDSLGSSEGIGFASSTSAPGAAAATARFTIGPHARVFTDDGREVEPGSGEAGMLAVGGYIPSGYYKDEKKSAATFRVIGGQRWSIPGDHATVEADGTITLLGRGSVCINSGGEKVFPEEVEEAVKQVDGVADCLVVGVPDERFGEAVTAVVAARRGAELDASSLPERLAGLARFKRPRHVVVVPEIVRGPNGKADYRWARATAADAVAAGSA